jgi:glycosyltransferase involved in cell wall biosynthesis
VATLNKPIKSDIGYAPIETIIHNIHKGLQSLGHRSIVACSEDSRMTGEQYVTVHRGLGDYCSPKTLVRQDIVEMHLSRALKRATMGDIDIIHMHEWSDYINNGIFNPPLPIVMTLHVSAKNSVVNKSHQRWNNPLPDSSLYNVAISDFQKREYSGLVDVCKTIHHGIEVEEFPFKEKQDKGNYLFSIGRITQVKGQDKAIELAHKTCSKLIISGCVQNKPADKEYFEGLKGSIDLIVDIGKHPVDKDYYSKVMKPLLDCDKQIIYIGELDNDQKKQWYRHARATLFPIQWGEPFGLVLIESMACGTPILAFKDGAVPEIVVDGKTGFIVDSLSDMIGAVDRIDRIDPLECRRHVQNHFSITRMANTYSGLYQQIVRDYQYKTAAVGLLTEHPSKPVLLGNNTA